MKNRLLWAVAAIALVGAAGCRAGNRGVQAAEQNSNEGNMEKKTLVAYFSRTGENYGVGNIEKGNTQIVAEMIASATGGKLFRIEPVKEYPSDYSVCVELAKAEAEAKARPAVKSDIAVEDYDVIYIGYPNWWGDMPMAVYTFIEKHSWQGKTVIPFCTHEGSGLSGTESNLKRACAGAAVLKGLAVQGTVAQKSQDRARKMVETWIESMAR